MAKRPRPSPARDSAADFDRLDHGVSETRPFTVSHEIWPDTGPGLSDMHYEVELGVLRAGRSRRHFLGTTQEVGPGDVWRHGLWEPHWTEILEAPVELSVFHAYPPALARLSYPEFPDVSWLELFTAPPGRRRQPGDESRRRILELARHSDDLAELTANKSEATGEARLRLRLLFMELLLELAAAAGQTGVTGGRGPRLAPERLGRAIEMVFASREPVSVAAAASACGMSRNRFSAEFRQLMGLGFANFGLRHRLSCAAARLRESDEPVKAIAEAWGFSHTSHFHRHFTRIYGCPPAQYRRP